MDLKEKWGAIVNCIADLLGPKAEVVLHDVRHPDHSIVMIRNGHVTGRGVGAPLTDLGFYMLRESEHKIDTLGVYRSKTDEGKVLLCNAANLRDPKGKVEAILCINIDVTGETERVDNRAATEPAEHYQNSIDQVICGMISDACRQVNGNLTRNHKFDLVCALDARGVFLARGSVQRVASALGLAVPTIYKYIQQGRRHQTTAKTIRKGWKPKPRHSGSEA